MRNQRQLAHLIVKLAYEYEGLSGEDTQNIERDLELHIAKSLGNPILPTSNESIAVSLDAPKTAALFFDRVWWCPTVVEGPPEEITVYGATDEEVWPQAIMLCLRNRWNWRRIEEVLSHETPIANLWVQQPAVRGISEALLSAHGITAVPVYESAAARDQEYKIGDTEVILAAVEDLRIVNENKLQWEQVIEFGSDPDARKKYRRMRHWLDSEMVGKPVSYISDALAIKLSDYEWALKEHGTETILGSLSSLIEPGFLSAASAATAGLAFAGGEFWAALGALGLIVGKAAISVTTKLVDLQDKKRGKDSEVAFVHEVKRKLG